MENGYVVIKKAFSKAKAAEWSQTLWIRLGLDSNDKSTWNRERIHMPWHKREPVATFSPKVPNPFIFATLSVSSILQTWYAMQDLLGEGRIDEANSTWGDSFILNLGTPELEGSTPISPQQLDNWHVDGDFFVHYLDSPEQALLVIPLFSDIQPRGGGTYISPDGIELIAKYLAAHPEGVVPVPGQRLVSSNSAYEDPAEDPESWSHMAAAKQCKRFIEVTGEVGDVVLLHPLMLHSASKNHLRAVRVITNPPVALKAPFNFDRENMHDFSLVELKTLRSLGVDRFDFRPTTERRRLVPRSLEAKNAMLDEEKKRLVASQHA